MDPNDGLVSHKVRGLIIGPPIEVTNNKIHVKNNKLDDQDLRTSLLYWDRLLYPQNGLFAIPSSAEEDFLVASGIMSKPRYPAHGAGGGDVFIKAQTEALLDMQNKEPGAWSLNGGANSLLILDGMPHDNNGITFQLLNAIPVPTTTCSLDDIIKFRQKRRPELLAFRSYFEDIAKTIENSPERENELREALKKVDESCRDLITVTREYQLPVSLSNVSASFNLDIPKAFVAASKTWGASEMLELGLTAKAISAFGAAVTSQFKLSSDISFKSMKKSRSPYRYIYHVQRDLKE
ncbi:DUF6236 family protein [Pseudomonas putida]